MMRDLTSLHATMAAANKAGHPRGGRRNTGASQQSALPSNDANGIGMIKQEDISLGMHQRPDTSTGYEGGHNGMMYQTSSNWHIQTSNMEPPRPSSRTTSNNSAASNGGSHSFRDSSQSFLVPPASAAASSTSASSQSFLSFAPTLSFGLPTDGARPTSSGRPPTSGADPSQPRSLPPLSAVVSASLPAPSSHQQSYASAPSAASQPFSISSNSSTYFPFHPPPLSDDQAPAAIARYRTSSLPPHPITRCSSNSKTWLFMEDLDWSALAANNYNYTMDGPPQQTWAPDQVDTIQRQQAQNRPMPPHFSSNLPTQLPRRPSPTSTASQQGRTHRHPHHQEAGESTTTGPTSRPQSRRLSVMELCNDDHNGASAGVSAGAFLLSGTATGGTGASRPGRRPAPLRHSRSLIGNDRRHLQQPHPPPPPSPREREQERYALMQLEQMRAAERSTAQKFSTGNGVGYGYAGAPGGRVSPANRRVPASSTATGAGAGSVFRGLRTPTPTIASSSTLFIPTTTTTTTAIILVIRRVRPFTHIFHSIHRLLPHIGIWGRGWRIPVLHTEPKCCTPVPRPCVRTAGVRTWAWRWEWSSTRRGTRWRAWAWASCRWGLWNESVSDRLSAPPVLVWSPPLPSNGLGSLFSSKSKLSDFVAVSSSLFPCTLMPPRVSYFFGALYLLEFSS